MYELHIYDMAGFDLENNLLFSLLLCMSWYKFDDKLFYLLYYLILLKLENIILFF